MTLFLCFTFAFFYEDLSFFFFLSSVFNENAKQITTALIESLSSPYDYAEIEHQEAAAISKLAKVASDQQALDFLTEVHQTCKTHKNALRRGVVWLCALLSGVEKKAAGESAVVQKAPAAILELLGDFWQAVDGSKWETDNNNFSVKSSNNARAVLHTVKRVAANNFGAFFAVLSKGEITQPDAMIPAIAALAQAARDLVSAKKAVPGDVDLFALLLKAIGAKTALVSPLLTFELLPVFESITADQWKEFFAKYTSAIVRCGPSSQSFLYLILSFVAVPAQAVGTNVAAIAAKSLEYCQLDDKAKPALGAYMNVSKHGKCAKLYPSSIAAARCVALLLKANPSQENVSGVLARLWEVASKGLSFTYQRVGVVYCLKKIASVLAEVDKACAETQVKKIYELYAKETNNATKQAILATLGKWAAYIPQDEFAKLVPEAKAAAQQHKGAPQKSRAAPKKAAAAAPPAKPATVMGAICGMTGDLHPAAMKCLRNASANWTAYPQQLAAPQLAGAPRVLSTGYVRVAQFAVRWESADVLKAFVCADAFFSSQYISRLSNSEVRDYASFLLHCLRQGQAEKRVYDAFFHLACHPSTKAVCIVKEALGTAKEHLGRLAENAKDMVVALLGDSATDRLLIPRLVDALCVFLRPDVPTPSALVTDLFFVTHHDLVASKTAWKKVAMCIGGKAEGNLVTFMHVAGIAAELLRRLAVTPRAEVGALVRAAAELISEVPDDSLASFFKGFVKLLSLEGFDKYTPREMEIAATPAGTFHRDDESLRMFRQFQSDEKVAFEKRQKSRGKTESVDDLKWDESVRREQERKRKEECLRKGEKWVPTSPEDKIVDVQDQIRARVKADMRVVENALDALVAMTAANPASVVNHLPLVVPQLNKLFAHPTLCAKALDAHLAVGRAICRNRRVPASLAMKDSYVLPRVERAGRAAPEKPEYDELMATVSDVVLELADICKCSGNNAIISAGEIDYSSVRTFPLRGEEFFFFFDVVAFAMSQPYTTETKHLHACAMKLLSAHIDPSAPVPREKAAVVLIDVIHEKPRYAHQALLALEPLCAGMSLEELRCLERGVLHPNEEVRQGVLDSMLKAPVLTFAPTRYDPTIQILIYMATHDPVEALAEKADELFERYGHPLRGTFYEQLFPYLSSPEDNVRELALRAFKSALARFPEKVGEIADELVKNYAANLPPPQEELFANPLSVEDLDAKAFRRFGAISAVGMLGDVLSEKRPLDESSKIYLQLLEFLLSDVCAADDAIPIYELSTSAQYILEKCPIALHRVVIPFLEKSLEATKAKARAKARGSELGVFQQEIVVLCLGSIALQSEKEKFKPIVELLIDTILTASVRRKPAKDGGAEDEDNTIAAGVQPSIANCFKTIAARVERELDIAGIFERLFRSTTDRSKTTSCGACYAIAGLVAGLGLRGLNRYGVIDRAFAMSTSKTVSERLGVFRLLEQLSSFLGMLFEPFITRLLPVLLLAYSDPSAEVRVAASRAAREVMSHLSSFGLKMILPGLIRGTAVDQWRTKKESIQLLGTMAFISPHKLSTCLPEVVPQLVRVLSDPHVQVQGAAQQALRDIAGTIGNPEIKAIAPAIVRALEDPAAATGIALEALENTAYIHKVDPPSLSLVIPIAERGLKEPKTEDRKRAAMIIGNLCRLTSTADLLPYLPFLVPALKSVVFDPSPEVRAVVAKAVANLVRGVGTEALAGLVEWIRRSVFTEEGATERAGAAQVFAEVLSVLPGERFAEYLAFLMSKADDPEYCVRDGVVCAMRFFPLSMPGAFEKHLHDVLPIVLRGFSDPNEYIRDSAERAGNAFVVQYYNTSVELLLPALERGLLDENFRIQETSLDLIDTLLGKIVLGGQNVGIATIKDPEGVLVRRIGEQHTASVLSTLNILKSYKNKEIAQKAAVMWKNFVGKPNKFIIQYLAVFMAKLLGLACSAALDSREMGDAALRSLFSRFNVRCVGAYIDAANAAIASPDPRTRLGALVSVIPVMETARAHKFCWTPPPDRDASVAALAIPIVKRGLCDEDADVRVAAGEAFSCLYHVAGAKANDEIITPLIRGLDGESRDESLSALCQIVRVQGAEVLPDLIPMLYAAPVSDSNLDAIERISEFTSESIREDIGTFIDEDFIPNIIATEGETREKLQRASLMLCVAAGSEGTELIMNAFILDLEKNDTRVKEAVLTLCMGYLRNERSKAWVEESVSVPDLITRLIDLFAAPAQRVQDLALGCLNALLDAVDKDESPQYVEVIQHDIGQLGAQTREVDGEVAIPPFRTAKAIDGLVQFYSNTIWTASPEKREVAANGLADLFRYTPARALDTPILMKAAGPLIRILGERFVPSIKIAFLNALMEIVSKGKEKLRYMVPQLQIIVMKQCKGPEKKVRNAAIECLKSLLPLVSKPELIVKDLLDTLASEPAGGDLPETCFRALGAVVKHTAISDKDLRSVFDMALGKLAGDDLTATVQGYAECSEASRLVILCVAKSPALEETALAHLLAVSTGTSKLAFLYHVLYIAKVRPEVVVDNCGTILDLCGTILETGDEKVLELIATALGKCALIASPVIDGRIREFLTLLVAVASREYVEPQRNAFQSIIELEKEKLALMRRNVDLFAAAVMRRMEIRNQATHAAEYCLFYLLEVWTKNGENVIKELKLDEAAKKRMYILLNRIASYTVDDE